MTDKGNSVGFFQRVTNIVTPFTFVDPNPLKVLGMDISHWAGGVVKFDVAKANGLDFVFIKAKDGYVTSKWFPENWAAAKAEGIPRGAYHWLYPSEHLSANTQASRLWTLLSGSSGELAGEDFGELPIVVDFEWTTWNGKPANPTIKDLYGFVTTWEYHTSQKPIIYTAPGYWNEYGSLDTFWAKYKLWIANYGVNTPTIPRPWIKETFWQWTTEGEGIKYGLDPWQKRAVDLDYYSGAFVDFQREFNLYTTEPLPDPDPEPIPIPPPQGEPIMTKVKCTNGVVIEKWSKYGYNFKAMTIPPEAIDISSFYYTAGKGFLAENLVNNDLKIFINASPYNPTTHLATMGLRINNNQIHPYVQFNPWIEFLADHSGKINHKEAEWKNVTDGAQLFRYLVENGVKNQQVVQYPEKFPDWGNREARRAFAIDSIGQIIIVTTEGDYPDKPGLTLHELTEELLFWVDDNHGYPIMTAADGDSGSSVQMSYYLDGIKHLDTGGAVDDRNTPAVWAYFRLLEPLVTAEVTEPGTDPEPPTDPGTPPPATETMVVHVNYELDFTDLGYKKGTGTITHTLEPLDPNETG